MGKRLLFPAIGMVLTHFMVIFFVFAGCGSAGVKGSTESRKAKAVKGKDIVIYQKTDDRNCLKIAISKIEGDDSLYQNTICADITGKTKVEVKDLNMDGFEDVVLFVPYEDHMEMYIFLNENFSFRQFFVDQQIGTDSCGSDYPLQNFNYSFIAEKGNKTARLVLDPICYMGVVFRNVVFDLKEDEGKYVVGKKDRNRFDDAYKKYIRKN